MPARSNGVIRIEVTPQPSTGSARKAMVGSRIVELAAEDIREHLEAVSRPVVAAMKAVQPDSCTVEFSLGIKGTTKVPVVLSGEANAAFKVSLTWKKGPA